MKVRNLIKTASVIAMAMILCFTAFGCNRYVKNDGSLPEGYVPDPAGKIRLQYYIARTESDKRSITDWISIFQRKYPNVTVETDLSNRGCGAIDLELAAKSIGDVFFMDETIIYKYAAEQNVLMPLDSYVEAYGIDVSNVFSAIYEMGVVKGKLYMVMRDYNHVSLCYNRDLVTSGNLEDPIEMEKKGEWTWDTFKSYCASLTTLAEETTQKTVGAQLQLGYSAVYIPFLEGWGGSWYDTVNKKVSFVSDPRVLAGVQEMIDVVQSNNVYFTPTDVTGKGASAIKPSPSQRDFNGYTPAFRDMVFISMASWGKEYDTQGTDWDVVSWPAFPTHKVGTGATGFGVFNGTKNADAAAALALSLYTEDGQRAYNGQEGGSVPNVRSLADASFWRVPFPDNHDDPVNGKNYDAFISFPEADTYARVECVLPPDIAEIVNKYMQNVIANHINGVMDMSDTLTKLETEANQTWEMLYAGSSD